MTAQEILQTLFQEFREGTVESSGSLSKGLQSTAALRGKGGRISLTEYEDLSVLSVDSSLTSTRPVTFEIRCGPRSGGALVVHNGERRLRVILWGSFSRSDFNVQGPAIPHIAAMLARVSELVRGAGEKVYWGRSECEHIPV